MAPKLTRRTLGRDALASAAATAAVVGAATPARADTPRDRVAAILPDLLAMLQDGMGPWHVPGVAVGVVVGDEVVLARGLGVRTAGTMDRVDADTIFQIGSTTKAFAATTEAILVDQHKLRWMDRVIDHDPGFRMSDPWVTREFRIIDLLAQRSGLRPYVLDTMWVLGYSADQLIAALRTARAVSSFRTTFAYQNVLHSVAGNIVAGLVGVPRWQDALSRLILEPLGMSSTTSSAAGMLAAADRATGHTFHGGQLVQQPLVDGFPYNAGPAGCMNSCVSDMVQWLRLLIGRGEIAGRRLVSAHALETTWKPRVEAEPGEGFPFVWQAYANGWVARQTERGTVVWHNGGTQQFRTHVGSFRHPGSASSSSAMRAPTTSSIPPPSGSTTGCSATRLRTTTRSPSPAPRLRPTRRPPVTDGPKPPALPGRQATMRGPIVRPRLAWPGSAPRTKAP